jgi:hypothetical protein
MQFYKLFSICSLTHSSNNNNSSSSRHHHHHLSLGRVNF